MSLQFKHLKTPCQGSDTDLNIEIAKCRDILVSSCFSKITFNLRKLETRYRVTFHMMDTERNCDRKIGENNMLFTGDKIEAFTNETKMKFYMAELKYCFCVEIGSQLK